VDATFASLSPGLTGASDTVILVYQNTVLKGRVGERISVYSDYRTSARVTGRVVVMTSP
jgi:hypothetical protein